MAPTWDDPVLFDLATECMLNPERSLFYIFGTMRLFLQRKNCRYSLSELYCYLLRRGGGLKTRVFDENILGILWKLRFLSLRYGADFRRSRLGGTSRRIPVGFPVILDLISVFFRYFYILSQWLSSELKSYSSGFFSVIFDLNQWLFQWFYILIQWFFSVNLDLNQWFFQWF